MSTITITNTTRTSIPTTWSKEELVEMFNKFWSIVWPGNKFVQFKQYRPVDYDEIVSPGWGNPSSRHRYDYSRRLMEVDLKKFSEDEAILNSLIEYIASRPAIDAEMPLELQLVEACEEIIVQVFHHEHGEYGPSVAMTREIYEEHRDHIMGLRQCLKTSRW